MDISRIAVVGGSLGGLTAALLLRDAGFDVDLYERSAKPLSGFGTGIVEQPELVRYLTERVGMDIDALSVSSSALRYLDARTGQLHGEVPASWRFTSYDTIYRGLFGAFGEERYHLRSSLVGLDQDADGVRLRFADGSDADADFVVAADGGYSVIRRRILGVEPTYAGYLTWRGLVEPGAVPDSTWDAFDDAFTYGLLPDGHLIAYPIPGGAPDRPKRLNFQWYWNVAPGPDFDEIMTDSNGIRLPVSVHHHALCPRQLTNLQDRAGELTPIFEQMVRAASTPFVTVVSDADVPATVFGRVVLIGDAAITPRPHAAAGAAKAANDAWTLAQALARPADERAASLADWERDQLTVGRGYLTKVRAMAERLQHGGEFAPGDPAFRFGLPQIAPTR